MAKIRTAHSIFEAFWWMPLTIWQDLHPGLEAVGVEKLRREAFVERCESIEHGVVDEVVGIDNVGIVAWLDDPAEARLPAEHPAGIVVLHVVDERHERRELGFRDHPVDVQAEV